MIKRQYACPTCGMKYPHDGAYVHSIVEFQEKERAKGSTVRR